MQGFRGWWLVAMVVIPTSCDLAVGTENGALVARFSGERIPLVPVGFPVYPKAFSTEALADLVDETLRQVTYRPAVDAFAGDVCASIGFVVCLDDLLANADYQLIDDTISDRVPEVRSWATDQLGGQLRFYEPGPLGVGVGEQIGRAIGGIVSFTDVTVSMTVRNRTDELWGVPVRFSLYMGDSQGVMSRSALLRPADTAPDQAYTFVLQPGESRDLVLEAPDLVDALNDFRSLSIDYDAVVEVGDLQPASFTSWLGRSKADGDGNGVADELASWGLVFEELSLSVSGKGELDVPVDFPDWMVDLVP
jgi:hypothetical protein